MFFNFEMYVCMYVCMKRKILNVMPECYVDTNLIDFLLDKQYETDISELTQIFGAEAQGI